MTTPKVTDYPQSQYDAIWDINNAIDVEATERFGFEVRRETQAVPVLNEDGEPVMQEVNDDGDVFQVPVVTQDVIEHRMPRMSSTDIVVRIYPCNGKTLADLGVKKSAEQEPTTRSFRRGKELKWTPPDVLLRKEFRSEHAPKDADQALEMRAANKEAAGKWIREQMKKFKKAEAEA